MGDIVVVNEYSDRERRIIDARSYKVVKSNELIQKSRFSLSLQEQKIILYLISKIKAEDMALKEHTFDISDFMEVCGLEKGGSGYKYIKGTLKGLRDRSIWITKPDGSETTLAWIDKVTISQNSGTVKIKIDDDMKPYLLQLQERFTSYELLYILALKSQYSIRMYELLKSYEYQSRIKFTIDELKVMLLADNYKLFADFKRKVLDISMREINELTDLNIKYEIIKTGRKYGKIEFHIKVKKDIQERLNMWARIEDIINPPQMSLFDDD